MFCGSDASHSCAYKHIMEESRRSYTQPDGSWLEITSKEIKRLIALLVKVGGSVDRNWSTETCCHGPVTGKVKTAEVGGQLFRFHSPGLLGITIGFMNAVEQSDQILGTKCVKEVHNMVVENSFCIDMAAVNSSIFSKENQAKCSDQQPALKCTVY